MPSFPKILLTILHAPSTSLFLTNTVRAMNDGCLLPNNLNVKNMIRKFNFSISKITASWLGYNTNKAKSRILNTEIMVELIDNLTNVTNNIMTLTEQC